MLRKIALLLAATTIVAVPIAAQNAKDGKAMPPAVGPAAADAEFVAKLHSALQQHPEFVLEAAQLAQQKERDRQLAAQNEKVSNLRPVLFAREAYGPVIGNPGAKTTVIELLDYACPFCKRSHDGVDKIADTNKDVRFVILMRPVLGPESEVLARFALAASLQGKFRQAHDALYDKFGDDHQTHSTDDNLREVATKAGVDFDRAKRDMTSDAVEKMLQKHAGIADQMGVSGTPFFVTPKGVIPGYATEEQLRAELAR